MNGTISNGEAFGSSTPGISPTTAAKNNAEWATSDAFSSHFDAFPNKIENVSIDTLRFLNMYLIIIANVVLIRNTHIFM